MSPAETITTVTTDRWSKFRLKFPPDEDMALELSNHSIRPSFILKKASKIIFISAICLPHILSSKNSLRQLRGFCLITGVIRNEIFIILC